MSFLIPPMKELPLLLLLLLPVNATAPVAAAAAMVRAASPHAARVLLMDAPRLLLPFIECRSCSSCSGHCPRRAGPLESPLSIAGRAGKEGLGLPFPLPKIKCVLRARTLFLPAGISTEMNE